MAKNIFNLYLIVGLFLSFVLLAQEASAIAAATSEAQQQLDGVQKTIDTAGQQVQSVQEKGIVQTIWDNAVVGITAAVSGIFQQISQIWNQIMSIFKSLLGLFAK